MPVPMRVLYIEDSAADADLARRVLARSAPEIELDLATSLAEGLRCLDEPGRHDLLLTDLSLPDGSGLGLLARVRDRRLPIAVVILTGSGDQEAAVAALKAGADDYQVKRGDYLERLPRALEGALTRFRARVERGNRLLRVLQVDHNTFDTDLVRRHLAQHAPHIQVDTVASADDALARLPARAGEPCAYDLLLLDYRLPGMDGLELTKALREDRELEIPIVLVTGHGGEDVAASALRLGVDDYLTKHEGWLFEIAPTLDRVQQRVDLARERASLEAASRRLSHLLLASPTILYHLRFEGDQSRPVWVSDNIERLLNCSPDEALQPGWWVTHVHPEDRERVLAAEARLLADGRLTHEYRLIGGSGRTHWIRDELHLTRDALGRPREAVGAWLDISDERRAQEVRRARHAVLDQIVANRPLAVILGDVARRLEALQADLRVSIQLLDERGRLRTGAAPSLPAFFNDAVDGLGAAEGVGSCGTAAFRGESIIVADVEEHAFWAPYRELSRRAGVRACWSVPFKDEAGRVLGTFGVYHGLPREPRPDELEAVTEFSRFAALAVQKLRATEALQQAAAFFAATRDGVVITDLVPRIVTVNRAYSEITGYSEEEVIGRNPNLASSGRHDKAFYQAMWASLTETGHWQGEVWNRRKNGEVFPEWMSISAVPDENGLPRNYVGVFTDISQIRRSEAQLEHLVHYDPLTSLPNRLLVQSRLQHVIDRADRHGRQVAVLYLDLDRFKNINDSLGHPVGDELLAMLAKRLLSRLREEDTLARLGGDEFLLVLDEVPSPDRAAAVAQALIDELATAFVLPSGHEMFMGVSIGISLYPTDAHSVTELIQHSDMAMYLAKQSGRNTYRFHNEALSAAASERLALETRLRRALAAGEFLLHYQPLIDAYSGEAAGVEALVRWQPPGEALVPPGRFIPIAEDSGLIVPLGEWVLRTACAQGRAWLDAGLPKRVMAVNISVRQFQSGNLVDLLRQVLADTGLPPECLELELTESMFMEHAEQAVATLHALKALGLRLAIDDFGTGYSSLAYLKRYPIDKLKIDQSFVRGLADDANDREIVATVIAMARVFKLEVLAEGVETREQLEFLQLHGCDYYQGYYFHRPAPAPQIEAWLAQTTEAH